MQLTIIVPVYNEATTLSAIIGRLTALPVEKEIIAVDDASRDDSAAILEKAVAEGKVLFLRHDSNQGKGAAIRTALERATGKYTVIQDADLEYDPEDIIRLLEVAVSKKADAVFGSRILGKSSGISYQRYYWGGRLLTWIANLLYNLDISDESTCYKMVRTDLLKSFNLKCRRFEFCPEVVARLGREKIKIYEIPIKYNPRKMREGKKIRWHDGLSAIWTLMKYRLFS